MSKKGAKSTIERIDEEKPDMFGTDGCCAACDHDCSDGDYVCHSNPCLGCKRECMID